MKKTKKYTLEELKASIRTKQEEQIQQEENLRKERF